VPFGQTRCEQVFLSLIGEDLNNKKITGRLFIRPFTIKSHIKSILFKSGVSGPLKPLPGLYPINSHLPLLFISPKWLRQKLPDPWMWLESV
jgi:hypothetical protein